MAGFPAEKRLLAVFEVSRGDFRRIGDECSRLKRTLLSIGFPSRASRRALIAVYEISMNIVIHAYHGRVRVLWDDGSLEIIAIDSGPGIPDIQLAMTDGYSTAPDHIKEMGFGAGMGLPNAKRSSDDFRLESTVGTGTAVFSKVCPGSEEVTFGSFFHSVRLDTDKCKGCTNCIKGCPTEAIRVIKGKAFILEDRCIDCGECIRKCPNKAKYVLSSTDEDLSRYDYAIALVPPSFYGQFPNASSGKIKDALIAKGGFQDVFDVAIAADLASSAMSEYVKEHASNGPLISAACPAVVRLIQVKYASLLGSIIPCEAPMELSAWLAKSRASQLGVANPTAVFISPCPAKITAIKQPVGRGRSLVDAGISATLAYSWVRDYLAGTDAHGEEFGSENDFSSTGFGMGWGRSGGEMEALGQGITGLSVDGIAQVSAVLEEIEKDNLRGEIDFVEAQACRGGCAGGCLHVENPFAAGMRIRQLSVRMSVAPANPILHIVSTREPQVWFSLEVGPRPTLKLDTDPRIAEEKLFRLGELEKELPGLDCGACGAPTCRALAEDIVLGRGSIWDCTFKLRERLQSLAEEIKELATKRPPAMAEESD